MCGAVGAGRLAVVCVERSPELEAVVAGPYDVIALVTAEDFDSLAKLSVSEIQVVDGVTRTLTCSVAHL